VISNTTFTLLDSIYPGGAEKVAWDKDNKHAWVITGEINDGRGEVSVVDYSNGFDSGEIVTTYGAPGDLSDVAISSKGLAAVSIYDPVTREGSVNFLSLADGGIESLGSVDVGYQPDQLTFTKNGNQLVTADEGEPLPFYGSGEPNQDPRGSVSIIDINQNRPGNSDVETLYFTKSNRYYENKGVRLFGFGMDDVEKFGEFDIEPEYVGIAGNKYAYVALQENNALAKVNLKKKKITGVFGLGLKNWDGIPIDTLEDDIYNPIAKEGLRGVRMPDGIDTFKIRYQGSKQEFFISPNEGDGRVRPDDIPEDSFVELEEDAVYSYGTTSTGAETEQELIDELTQTVFYLNEGEVDGATSFVAENDEYVMSLKYGPVEPDQFWSDETDPSEPKGDVTVDMSNFDSTFVAEDDCDTAIDINDPVTGQFGLYGGRSFSIHDDKGGVIYDSGNLTEEIAAEFGYYPDNRSGNKGTEPEAIEHFKLKKRHFIAVALERVYNNADPDELGSLVPVFEVIDLEAENNDDRLAHVGTFVAPQSHKPEGLFFVKDSKRSGTMLIANEDSGTLDSFAFSLSDLA
jgi:hypothetical protein